MDPLKLEVQVIVRCPVWVLRTKSKSPPRAAHAANRERLSISSNNYDCVFKSKTKGRGMEVSSRCDVLDVELGSLREMCLLRSVLCTQVTLSEYWKGSLVIRVCSHQSSGVSVCPRCGLSC